MLRAAILALNVLAVLFAPRQSAVLLAGAGCLSALCVPAKSRRTPVIAAGLLFVTPLLSRWFAPHVGFLVVDARLQLASAWVILAFALIVMSRPATPDALLRLPHTARWLYLMLFVLWSSVLWLIVVWDAGIGRIVPVDRNAVLSNCGGDVLPWIFGTWDAHGAARLLFLPFRTPPDFVTRTVYENHSQAYLVSMYVIVKTIQLATSKPLHYATNLLPFVHIAIGVAALAVLLVRDRALEGRVRASTLLWLFLLLGVVLTQWRFWHDMYVFSGDNPFPFLGTWLVLFLAMMVSPARPGLALAVAGTLGLFNPFIAPAVLLAVLCLYPPNLASESGIRAAFRQNWLIFAVAVALAGAAVVSFAVPRLLIAWRGYHTFGSSFLMRSGLDGDTRYFQSIWQAIVSPCTAGCCGGGRPVAALLIPALIPLGLAAVLAVPDRTQIMTLGRRLVFISAPYLFSAILFGEAVSVHPYLYDHVFMTPVTIIGVAALFSQRVQQRLRGSVLLCALLLMAAVVMSNLIAIAQSFPQ